MPSNELFFTIIAGYAVVILATLLVRRQSISSGIHSYILLSPDQKGQAGKLLAVGSCTVSLLAFFIIMWELLG